MILQVVFELTGILRARKRRDGAANDSPSFSEMHFDGSEDEEGKGETAGTEYLYRVSKGGVVTCTSDERHQR